TTYTWVKYADEKDGTGISDSPSGKMYIGLAFNKTTQTESTNPKDYQWSAMYDEEAIKGIGLADKTGILSGTEIYTDKADDDSVVHVEVDGKSGLQAPVGEGRNLLKDGLTSSGASVSKQSDGSYKITNPSKSDWGRAVSHPIVLEPNQEYTASMEVLSRTGSYAGIGFREGNSDYGNLTLSTTKGKVSTTYKNTTTSSKKVNVWVKLYYAGTSYNKPTDNASIHIRGLQVEKGSTATPYTPAPEDVEDNIQSVNNFDIISQRSDYEGGRNLFLDTQVERTSSREFLNHSTWDMAPIIEEYGLDTYYTVSFDIKSKVAGNINLYAQNGNGTKYGMGTKRLSVGTDY